MITKVKQESVQEPGRDLIVFVGLKQGLLKLKYILKWFFLNG